MIVQIIVSSKKLHLSCYWLSDTFSLYNFTSWLYFLTLLFVNVDVFWSDWCINFNETFFFLLALILSESETTFGYNFAILYSCLFLYFWIIFEKLRQSFERWYSHWIMHVFENCIDDCALYFCEIFRDHHFVDAQFMFYSLIICYEIHVKLVHCNFAELKR